MNVAILSTFLLGCKLIAASLKSFFLFVKNHEQFPQIHIIAIAVYWCILVGNSRHLIYSAYSLYIGEYFLVYFQFSVAQFMERDLSQETAIQKKKKNITWYQVILSCHFSIFYGISITRIRTILRSEKNCNAPTSSSWIWRKQCLLNPAIEEPRLLICVC